MDLLDNIMAICATIIMVTLTCGIIFLVVLGIIMGIQSISKTDAPNKLEQLMGECK